MLIIVVPTDKNDEKKYKDNILILFIINLFLYNVYLLLLLLLCLLTLKYSIEVNF